VTISFEAADDLSTGRFRIRSRAQARVTGSAEAGHSHLAPTDPEAVRRVRTVLEVNGTRHRLNPPGLVVGRGAEADVRINDPGVSRRHIELVVPLVSAGATGEAGASAITIKDLGSTNGMLVNGQKVTTAEATDGTWIKIGNTTLTIRILDDV
jgi:FHA domain